VPAVFRRGSFGPTGRRSALRKHDWLRVVGCRPPAPFG
jgi:hypothetical protein